MSNEPIEATAITVQEDTPASLPESHQPGSAMIATKSIFDIKPREFKAGLNRRKKNRDSLFEWLQDNLLEGTDWGRIHVVGKDQCKNGKFCQNMYHFSKPSLWKSGAEKIVGMLGLRVTWPDLKEEKRGLKEDNKIIIMRARVVNDSGQILSEGMGARGLDQDYGDVNKAIKMAKKSSMIDAVINLGGMSELFTQDIENMDSEAVCAADPMNPDEGPADTYFPKKEQNPVETHCPIGKQWKGKRWEDVDIGFLTWIITTVKDKPELVTAAKKQLAGRGDEGSLAAERAVDNAMRKSGGKKLAEFANELTAATNIDQIIAIKDELREEQYISYEPSLRTFIETRQHELGPK